MEKKIEFFKISELKPYENNSRVHPEKQIEALRKSIRDLGIVKPIIIDENNTILAGHGVFSAAKAEGLTSLPCIRNTTLSDEQKRAFVITDNKMSDMSYFDMDILVQELQVLSDMNFDTLITGFDIDDLIGDDMSSIGTFFEDQDNIPAKEEKPKTICCPACGEEFEL